MDSEASEHAFLTPAPLPSVLSLLSQAHDARVSVLNLHATPRFSDVVVDPQIDMKEYSQCNRETHNLVILENNCQENTEERPADSAADLDKVMLMPEKKTQAPDDCVLKPRTGGANVSVVVHKQEEPEVMKSAADGDSKRKRTYHKVEEINAVDGKPEMVDNRTDVESDNKPHVEVEIERDFKVARLAGDEIDGKVGKLVDSNKCVVEETPVVDSTAKHRDKNSDDADSTQVEQNEAEVRGGEQLKVDFADGDKSDAQQNDEKRTNNMEKNAAQKNNIQNDSVQSDAVQGDLEKADCKPSDNVKRDVVQSVIKQGSIKQSDVFQSDYIRSDVRLDVGNHREVAKMDSTNQDGVERNECKMDVVGKDDFDLIGREKIEIGSQISMSDSMSIDVTGGEKRPSPSDTSAVEANSEASDSKYDEPSSKRLKLSPEVALGDACTDNVKSKKPSGAPKYSSIPTSKLLIPSAGPTKPVHTRPGSQREPRVASFGGIPVMLRSSPVPDTVDVALQESIQRHPIPQTAMSDAAGNLNKGHPGGVGGGRAFKSGSATVSETQMSVKVAPRKAKSVRWASEEKLVDVKYIDTCVQPLQSWDPKSNNTLSLSPPTLRTPRGISEKQSRAGSHTEKARSKLWKSVKKDSII